MSRRKRNWLDRSCYHITHRCLDRKYFFEHALTRDTYLKELREMTARFNVDILNYMITSNHVHILVYAGKGMEIEKGMQYLQGRMAQRYNMRTGREGAFWSGRYHATLIESGNHLSQCLFYIDYNMMRAGAVSHPSEWRHSGYHEISGTRKRYRIINKKKLLKKLGMAGEHVKFLEWYGRTIDSKSKEYMQRQKYWTEALAVGSQAWIQGMKGKIGINRLRIVHEEDMKQSGKKIDIFYSRKESPQTNSVSEDDATYALY
jgi:putative transposase